MAGTVIVPWYATGFRADGFEEALGEAAAVALRYGASSYGVYRARDDRYKFQQLAAFEEHLVGNVQRLLRHLTRGSKRRKLLHGGIEMQHQALNAL